MKNLLLALVALAPLGVIASDDAHTFKISNIKVGLACGKANLESGQGGWVCQPVKDIYVVDQGTCVYDKREVPCTWTGIEFDYQGVKAGAKLICTETSGLPSAFGNPRSVSKSGTKQFTYELPLDKSTGHRFEAQYVVFEVHDVDSEIRATHTQCSIDNHLALSFDQVFHYPTNGH
ncbi:hypothetical protein [Dyella sp. 2HG41-7]|uniref:hypothetical protein n=1 Tax=Dyella sp. 2HG41-7 TaxID=2883239 RepID=UPI001F1D4227|nr:hypothetical protein [Dyella sp. 2HG41-7]